MGRAEQAADPSMEEILASIRKIIAEDSPAPEAAAETVPARSGPQLAVVPDPVVEDDETADEVSGTVPEETAPDESAADEPEARADLHEPEAARSEPVPADMAEPVGMSAAPEPSPEADREPLQDAISQMVAEAAPQPEPASATTAATETTSRAKPAGAEPAAGGKADGLLSPHANEAVQSAFDQLAHTILGQQSRTLEDLVQEMLRPMLRNWLDDNLPVLVERLVREEIERVSRGRR